MDKALIFGIVCCGITIAVAITAVFIIRHLLAKITILQLDVNKYRNYVRYQQKTIDGLREHNGNLYDENATLKNNMATLNNIPDFSKKW